MNIKYMYNSTTLVFFYLIQLSYSSMFMIPVLLCGPDRCFKPDPVSCRKKNHSQ